MFGFLDKRDQAGPWQGIELAPENTVLILAVRTRRVDGGAGGTVYYPAQARIGWKVWPDRWTDFTTGGALDIEPEIFMVLPDINPGPPLQILNGRAKRRRWGS